MGGSAWTLPARKWRSPNSGQLGHWEERYSGGIWPSMQDILLWGGRGLAGQEFEEHRSNGTSARGVARHTEPLSCTQVWQRYSLRSVTGHKTCPDEWSLIQTGTFPSLPNFLLFLALTQNSILWSAARLWLKFCKGLLSVLVLRKNPMVF